MLKQQTEEQTIPERHEALSLSDNLTHEEIQQTEVPTKTKQTVDTLLARLKKQLRLQRAFHIGTAMLALPLSLLMLMGLLYPLAPEKLGPLLQTVYSFYPLKFTEPAITTLLPGGEVQTSQTTQFDVVTPALLALACVIMAVLARRQRGKITRMLAQHNDVRAIGALAQALEIGNKHVVAQATDALIRLLPQMQSADASLLDTQQRTCLHRALRGKNTELALAILEAFGRIGNSHDLAVVEELSQHAADRSVREAAQRILPTLRQTIQQQTDAQTLLRSSQRDSSSDPAELLRGILPDRL